VRDGVYMPCRRVDDVWSEEMWRRTGSVNMFPTTGYCIPYQTLCTWVNSRICRELDAAVVPVVKSVPRCSELYQQWQRSLAGVLTEEVEEKR